MARSANTDTSGCFCWRSVRRAAFWPLPLTEWLSRAAFPVVAARDRMSALFGGLATGPSNWARRAELIAAGYGALTTLTLVIGLAVMVQVMGSGTQPVQRLAGHFKDERRLPSHPGGWISNPVSTRDARQVESVQTTPAVVKLQGPIREIPGFDRTAAPMPALTGTSHYGLAPGIALTERWNGEPRILGDSIGRESYGSARLANPDLTQNTFESDPARPRVMTLRDLIEGDEPTKTP